MTWKRIVQQIAGQWRLWEADEITDAEMLDRLDTIMRQISDNARRARALSPKNEKVTP